MKLKSASWAVLMVWMTTVGFAQSQESLTFNNKEYLLENGVWSQVTQQGDRFRVNPEIITIKFMDGASRNDEESVHRQLGGTPLKKAITGFMDVRINAPRDVISAVQAYQAHDKVAIAELNTFGSYTIVPDDSSYGSQWCFPVMEGPMAWDIQTGSPDVFVAILDSGSEFSHEDMGIGPDGYQNIWLNSGEDAWSDPNNPNTGNGIDDDNNGYVDDWKGYDFSSDNNNSAGPFFHGTHVAGIVGAKTNNNLGMAGVAGGWGAPGVKLMICGVGDSAPNGSVLDDAVLYALEHGAQIVQMSLTVGQSAANDAAFQMAVDNGMLVVCASGNSASTTIGYPSSNTNVLSVGSTNESDQRSSFSNHGAQLEISAPGSNIFSTGLNNTYGTSSGTSFAAPVVSGVAALIFSAQPGISGDEVRQILKDTADKVGGYDYNWNGSMPGHSFELGYGRVNPFAALSSLGTELYIRDSVEDTGSEPNTESGDEVWASPDIWNCVNDPNCTEHQEPVFGETNYVRVRVNSISPNDLTANLHLYWTRARTGELWPDHWLHPDAPGSSNLIDGQVGGAEITVVDNINFAPDPIPVPSIPAGTSEIFTRTWEPPDPAWYPLGPPAAKPMIGLLARLVSTEDPITSDNPGFMPGYVRDNNNVATRNTWLSKVDPDNPDGPMVTFNVHNIEGAQANVDIHFHPIETQTYPGSAFLTLSTDLNAAWVNGGSMSEGLDGSLEVLDPNVGAWLRNIVLDTNATYAMGVQLSLPPGLEPPDDAVYYFAASQHLNGTGENRGAVNLEVMVTRSWLGLLPDWPEQVSILDILDRLP